MPKRNRKGRLGKTRSKPFIFDKELEKLRKKYVVKDNKNNDK